MSTRPTATTATGEDRGVAGSRGGVGDDGAAVATSHAAPVVKKQMKLGSFFGGGKSEGSPPPAVGSKRARSPTTLPSPLPATAHATLATSAAHAAGEPNQALAGDPAALPPPVTDSAATSAKKARLDNVVDGASAADTAAVGVAGVGGGDGSSGDLASAHYHPIKDAPWTIHWSSQGATSPHGGPVPSVPYSALVAVFSAIDATKKRLIITAVLTNFFRSLIVAAPDDLLPALYLCTNTLAPAYESLELGVGDSILMKALGEATGRHTKDIKAEADEKGDLGLVAETSRAKQKTLMATFSKPAGGAGGSGNGGGMTIASVYKLFKSIALESGKASQDKKVATIKRMLVGASGVEAKYLVRSMQGKLRIGLAKNTVLAALAQAFAITSPLPTHDPTVYVDMKRKATDATAAHGAGGGDIATALAKQVEGSSGAGHHVTSKSRVIHDEEEDGDSKMAHAVEAVEAGGVTEEAVAAAVDAVVGPPTITTPEGAIMVNAIVAPPSLDDRGIVVVPRHHPFCPVVLDARKGLSSSDAVARVEETVRLLKQVYSEMPSYDALVPALLKAGIGGARSTCALTPGIPVSPMLAKPTKGIREILTRFEGVTFTCEWKYDGERAQVHKVPGGGVTIFSRNSENTTGKYPDLEGVLMDAMAGGGVESCVLDGEVVAYDRDKKCLMPFQVLSTRARKDVAISDIKVQVIYAAFDLLFLNGRSLLMLPLVQRRQLLKAHFKEVEGRFSYAVHAESNDTEEIAAFLNDAVKGSCEGLMIKVLDGPDSVYEPSKRSLNWLKLKKDYMDGLTDSLDLVPIAAWKGKGKRTGAFGAYLLACYDPEEEMYQSITRIGTGFSDERLAELDAVFKGKEHCITHTRPSNVLVSEGLKDVDVWFDPDHSEVWEIMAADLSISPVHMAALGKVDASRGIALRFPRFLRRRDDKSPADASTCHQVADMYRSQSATIIANGDDDEDMDA